MHGTIASQIFMGIIVIIVCSFLAQAANLKTLGWIFRALTEIWFIVFIILFQPEIRRMLSTVARNRIVRIFLRMDANESIEEITEFNGINLKAFEYSNGVLIQLSQPVSTSKINLSEYIKELMNFVKTQ